MESPPKRKTIRLRGANYSTEAVYFLTFCTKDRKCILSRIEENDDASVALTRYGNVVDKYIKEMSNFYDNLSVEAYVIMPNHVHILLYVKDKGDPPKSELSGICGPSGTPVLTAKNSVVSRFLSTLKRFCNKEFGENIWQGRSYDHIIRNGRDYDEHLRYILLNPARWRSDELFSWCE